MTTTPLTRTYSLRKPVRPLIDIDEEEDNRRRDSSGRKRVDVVQCLLDSSDDEIDDEHIPIEKLSTILWLTFNEICHIRHVLTQTSLIYDKQAEQIRNGRMCFRCRKKISGFFFLPSFLRRINHEVCFICQQNVCKKCSSTNFIPPTLNLYIPVRIQTLTKPLPNTIENKKENIKKSNLQTRIVCHGCSQVFHEHTQTSQYRIKPPITPFRRTFSLPPASSKTSNEIRAVRHRRRPTQQANSNTEKSTANTSIRITKL